MDGWGRCSFNTCKSWLATHNCLHHEWKCVSRGSKPEQVNSGQWSLFVHEYSFTTQLHSIVVVVWVGEREREGEKEREKPR